MRWDKLRTFYYVAKFGSFTKAAQHLCVAQPAISRQVSDLEHRIGHPLFKRLPKGLVLTEQGQLLFQSAEKMCALSELALTQIENDQIEPHGDLRIGANVGHVDTWLYTVIPDFLKRYPTINLSILSKDGHLDVESLGIHVALQPFRHDQTDLVQNLLTRWSRRLYASREYLEQYGLPKTVEDLAHHRLIAFGSEPIHLFDNIDWHLKLSSNNKTIQKPYLCVNSIRSLFHLGNQGFGIISFSQESILLKDSNLIEVLPEIAGPNFDIYFTYPVQLKGIKKIQVLEDYLQSYVKEHHRKYVSPPFESKAGLATAHSSLLEKSNAA